MLSLATIILATFWGGPGVGPMTLKFEHGLHILAMHLFNKFHHPMFNRSEVIVLTNRDSDENIHLSPVEKYIN